MSVLVGKQAPDFTVPAVLGNGTIVDDFNLSEAIKGKYGLVFFYPLDFTFVCPSELIALDHRMDEFKARNVEVIVWRLSIKRKKNGELFLVTNEINSDFQNLSFEREFGKIIGRTDYFAYVLSEKKERYITRAIQGTALNILLPFL